MGNTDKKIIVIGAGAVGAITAAYIKRAGYSVELVCKYEDYTRIASEQGIKVTGILGEFTQKIDSYTSIEEVAGKRDIILLAVKANDLVDTANRIKPLLYKDSLIVSMQNGICEFELQNIVGSERVVSSIVGWGATMKKPGEVVLTSMGDFVLGYPDREYDNSVREIATILESVLPVRLSSEMLNQLYSKLIINSCVTSLGAITGLLLGDMLRRRRVRLLFIEIIREAMELAYVMKINVSVYGGRLDYYDFIAKSGYWGRVMQHLTIRAIGMKYRRLKSSSLQSLERGKLTEIDYLNGFIASNGKQFGVPVPVNSEIVKMIHEIEEGTRKIGTDNLEDKVFQKFYG
jgi:2-dehydropantoate 2-reductase